MRQYIYVLGITCASFLLAPLAAEARVDGSGRQVVGERAERPRERLDEAPLRGKHRCHWHFGLNLLMPAAHFCAPPPPAVVYVDRPAPVFVERPAPVYVDRPVYIDRPVVHRAPAVVEKPNFCDRSVRNLSLVSGGRSGERICLDGHYGNLETLDLEVQGSSARLDLDGDYPRLADINVESGAGDVRARLRGSFPNSDEINFTSSTGNIDLDLRGRWKNDCTLNLTTQSGDIHLRLPPQIGVIVKVDGACDCVVSNRMCARATRIIIESTSIVSLTNVRQHSRFSSKPTAVALTSIKLK